MREILFRGKRIDNGEWVYGFPWINRSHTRETFYITDLMGEIIQVIPETVSQYTGLKDKNGREIFEGDIVRHGLFKQDYKMIVRYREESAAFMFGDKRTGFSFSSDQTKYLEIIGNVHENPELLEVHHD